MSEPQILDEKVIRETGGLKWVVRWLRGIHPDRGQIVQGLTGPETVEEKCIIKVLHRFNVVEATSPSTDFVPASVDKACCDSSKASSDTPSAHPPQH